MTRRKLVAGNWKMHGDRQTLNELDAIAGAARAEEGVDVALALPATLIALATDRELPIAIGAQDVHQNDKGAHTGCLSATMVREAGASFTLVGHSERRADQHETDVDIKGKAAAAHRAGLTVILCVGESSAQRDGGEAEAVVTGQVSACLPEDTAAAWLSIAYEPVWAIGTGRTPTVAEVAAMHGAIRERLRALLGEEAEAVRLLYGGSVNAENARELMSAGDVDGALVGGASLTAAKFVPIVKAAGKI